MNQTITLPVSGATVELIPHVTGGILLDISKNVADLNKYLINAMVVSITPKPAEGEVPTPVTDKYEAVRQMHGRDFKALDLKLQAMLEEAKDPAEGGK